MTDSETRIKVDISFNMTGGQSAAKLIQVGRCSVSLCSYYALRIVFVTIKWLKMLQLVLPKLTKNPIVIANENDLNNYKYSCKVIK